MAFERTKMQSLNHGANVVWLYSGSAADDITGAGYFNSMADTLKVGDHILHQATLSAVHVAVSANDGSVVTVV